MNRMLNHIQYYFKNVCWLVFEKNSFKLSRGFLNINDSVMGKVGDVNVKEKVWDVNEMY